MIADNHLCIHDRAGKQQRQDYSRFSWWKTPIVIPIDYNILILLAHKFHILDSQTGIMD